MFIRWKMWRIGPMGYGVMWRYQSRTQVSEYPKNTGCIYSKNSIKWRALYRKTNGAVRVWVWRSVKALLKPTAVKSGLQAMKAKGVNSILLFRSLTRNKLVSHLGTNCRKQS